MLVRPTGLPPLRSVYTASTRASAPGPLDTLHLSGGDSKPGKPWYARLKDWALGTSEQAAVSQAPLPVQVAKAAEQPPAPAPVRTAPAPAKPAEVAPSTLDDLRSLSPAKRAKALPAFYQAMKAEYPAHVALAEKASKAASDDEPRSAFAIGVLKAAQTGATLEQAALAGMDAIPSSFPSNAANIGLAVGQNVPSLTLARAGLNAASDNTVKIGLIRAGLKNVGQPPGPLAQALLASIPSNYPSNRRAVSDALVKELKKDPEVGPAMQLAAGLAGACSDTGLQPGIHESVLASRLAGETNPGKLAMTGINSIPKNYPSNRGSVIKQALKTLQSEPQLEGYARLGQKMCNALSDQGLATNIGLSVIDSGLQNLTLAQTASRAMDTIPANYPSNRNLVGKAVLGALADSADVKLALKMINASDDQSCQNAMMVAALDIVTGEQKDPLVVSGKKLLATIPSNYPSNKARVARALLDELRVHYTEPDARGKIDAAIQRLKAGSKTEVEVLLEELIKSKTAAQEVVDLANAVTGKENKTGIEERGSVVVIGGVRVKVKNT